MSHPLAPFFISLSGMGIRPMPADYMRIHLALSAGGAWTLGQLCDLLVALLVNDFEQERRFRLQFAEFFVQEKEARQIPIDLDRALDDLRRLVGGEWSDDAPAPLKPVHPIPMRALSKRWNYRQARGWVGVLLLLLLVGGGAWWHRELLLNYFAPPQASETPIQESPPAPPSLPPEPTTSDAPDTRQRRYAGVPRIEISHHEGGDQEWVWGGAAVLLSSASVMYGFWLRRRKPSAEKIDHTIREGFRPGLIGGSPAPWLTRDALDHLADCLGYFRSENPGRVMDTSPTVRRTAAAGGVPVIAFERERRLKNLLILEDLLTEARTWNPVAGELAQGLLARGVPVLRGRFRGVPDQFLTEEGAVHHLEDYADQRNGIVVLIFSDGTGVGREGRLLLETVASWPLVAWMELRELRAWDASTARIAALGFPLYPATEAGLRSAMGRLLTEQGNGSPTSNNPACWQGLPDPPDGKPTAEWLETVLGDALSWAQACSRIMPPVSFGLADALRRSGLVGTSPPQRLERLLALPHTQYNTEGFRFAPPVRSLLREGYLDRHAQEERSRIHDLIQGLTRAAEPPDKTPTLRHLAWQFRYWFFELDAEDSARHKRAHQKLAALRAGAMGSAVRQEIAAIRSPNPDPGDPEQQQLARLVSGVPLRQPWGHWAACLLLAAGGLGCGYYATELYFASLDFVVDRRGLEDGEVYFEMAGGWYPTSSWQGSPLSSVPYVPAYTLQLAAFKQHPGPQSALLLGTVGAGVGAGITVKIVLESKRQPCREELPDWGLTIVRCPPGEAKIDGVPVDWDYPTWRQTLKEKAGERLLSIGLDIREGKGKPQLTRLDHLLLETRAVDQLYVVQGDQAAAERVIKLIREEFAPWLARSQLLMWSELPFSSPAEVALGVGNFLLPTEFGRTFVLDTAHPDNPTGILTELLWSWKSNILEEADLRQELPSATITGDKLIPILLPAFKKDIGFHERLAPVHELTEEQKQRIALAWWIGNQLMLDDLRVLTPRVAQILASWRGNRRLLKISLMNLQTISVEAARLLSHWRPAQPALLHLGALKNLDRETAQAIAAWKGSFLSLGGLQTLSPETAQAIAAWKGNILSLGGLQTLSPEIAKSLAMWKGSELRISGLKSLPLESISVLREWGKAEERVLDIPLDLLPPSIQVRLTVRAVPSVARVRILKIKEKYRPGISLKPGIYELEVSHPGFKTARNSVSLGWREEEEIRITLQSNQAE